MPDGSHLSIGEVLSLLRDEFPDVTISKIRFLESQGLVDPERTPSGYRKFYEHDVDRLRWILRQQRENFLPLKVIKGRLTDQGDDDSTDAEMAELELSGSESATDPVGVAAASRGPAGAVVDGGGTQRSPAPGDAHHPRRAIDDGSWQSEEIPGDAGPPGSSTPAGDRSHHAPLGPQASPVPAPGPSPAPSGRRDAGSTTPLDLIPAAPAVLAGAGGGQPTSAAGGNRGSPSWVEEDDSLTLEELMTRSGLDKAQIDELTRFSLITPASSSGGDRYYDADALSIATAAAGFARHGVEARHLRGWRTSAEREVSLFEQVVVPLLRQRNPQARTQAAATLDELADLGASLREVLVRRAQREIH